MDTLDNYRQIIKQILREYAQLTYTYEQLERQLILDESTDHYLLMTMGWENKKRVHGCLIHIDILNLTRLKVA